MLFTIAAIHHLGILVTWWRHNTAYGNRLTWSQPQGLLCLPRV